MEDSTSENRKNKIQNKNYIARRNFLKKTITSVVGIGTAAMIPSVTGFNINAGEINYFNSNNNQKFGIDSNGVLNTDKIGTISEPVKSINVNEIHSESLTPNIVLYEENGIAKAVTKEKTYTDQVGSNNGDIFSVAQKAINDQFKEERSRFHSKDGAADIHIAIKPAVYNVSNTISITEQGVERVTISGSGAVGQVRINTDNVPDNKTIIEINPRANSSSERNRFVVIKGIAINDEDENSRTKNGIYINDTHHAILKGCLTKGYKRGIWFRNIWQGKIDHCFLQSSGSSKENTAALQIGASNETETYQATNHIEISHLQGDPGNNEFEYAVVEILGKATRIDINFPNIELPNDLPGIIFDASNIALGNFSANLRGAQITGGDPAIQTKAAPQLSITGGDISASSNAIKSESGSSKLVIGGGINLNGGDESDVVHIENGWVNIENFRIGNGKRGLNLNYCQIVNINGGTIRNCKEAGVRLQACGDSSTGTGVSITGTQILGSSTEGENPIWFTNCDNVSIEGVQLGVGNTDSEGNEVTQKAGIKDKYSTDNISLGNISATNKISETIDRHRDSSFKSNKGTVSKADGGTITHNLAGKPKINDVNVKTSSSNKVYVRSADSNNLKIALENPSGDPVTKEETIYWNAEL